MAPANPAPAPDDEFKATLALGESDRIESKMPALRPSTREFVLRIHARVERAIGAAAKESRIPRRVLARSDLVGCTVLSVRFMYARQNPRMNQWWDDRQATGQAIRDLHAAFPEAVEAAGFALRAVRAGRVVMLADTDRFRAWVKSAFVAGATTRRQMLLRASLKSGVVVPRLYPGQVHRAMLLALRLHKAWAKRAFNRPSAIKTLDEMRDHLALAERKKDLTARSKHGHYILDGRRARDALRLKRYVEDASLSLDAGEDSSDARGTAAANVPDRAAADSAFDAGSPCPSPLLDLLPAMEASRAVSEHEAEMLRVTSAMKPLPTRLGGAEHRRRLGGDGYRISRQGLAKMWKRVKPRLLEAARGGDTGA